MARKKKSLPFDKRGGVIATSRHLLESEHYLSMSVYSRSLLILLHLHWRNDKPVAYGTREAAQKLCCDRRTAMKAFNELERRQFIQMYDAAEFNSRHGSKARTWILTWLPFRDRKPTNDWEVLKEMTST
ncbi:MAG: Uncharacterised protein [Marinobacterium sp. xm-d-530]|nr:MAG: Uncharacterised protein [Marinobacterium sp. xm-d-530]